MRALLIASLVASVALVAGCPGDDGNDPSAIVFPTDYAATYQEVRACRQSGGAHDINNFRVLADPAALTPYNDRATAFPVGAVVLKEEYDFGDSDCSGPIVQWSAMAKLDADAPAELLGWRWQRVSSLEVVLEEDVPRCYGCHQGCGGPPDGYDGTCTVP